MEWISELIPYVLLAIVIIAATVAGFAIGGNRVKAFLKRKEIFDEFEEKTLRVELNTKFNDFVDAIENRPKQLPPIRGEAVIPPLEWKDDEEEEDDNA